MCKTEKDLQNALEVGKRLKKLRKGHKLTQEQLAEALGCSRERISRAENGRVCLSHSFILILADYFQVDTDYFSPTKGDKNNNEDR